MNYQKHYDTLINRAKTRLLEGYSERHHIIPRCMGGTDEQDNLITLTAEEHYVAHQLLVKMYPDNYKLIYAAKMMTISNSGHVRNNKLYGWLRVKFSSINSSNLKEHYQNNPEARSKMSAIKKEYYQNNPEARSKMSAFWKNNPEKNPMNNPEARAKISASMTEYSNKPEVKAKRSASTKEYYQNNPEARAKHSARMKELYKNNPEKNPMNNPEARAKVSAFMKEYHQKKKLANG